MTVSGRIIRFFVISSFITLITCSDFIEDRNGRHLFTLFEYLRGLNNAQSNAKKFHPYYILPSVLVLPSVNQHQNVNIQESSGQETYQENGKTVHINGFAKLISNESSVEIEETKTSNITVFKKHEKNETMNENKLKVANPVAMYNVDDLDFEKGTTIAVNIASIEITTQANGPYPSPQYKYESINNEELRNVVSINSNDTFQGERGESPVQKNYNNKFYNKDLYPALDDTGNKTISVTKAPLGTTIYNYTLNLNNNLPPIQDNRWRKFLTMKNYYPFTLNGFKPLAGLYYDGFLHRPITKKMGFLPIKELVK